jgi:hypothetical protein
LSPPTSTNSCLCDPDSSIELAISSSYRDYMDEAII